IDVHSKAVSLLELYPNPTEGKLQLNMNLVKKGEVEIEIYSLEGKILYQQKYGETKSVTEQIEMSAYAKGVYIVKIKVDAENIYQKVIKQ
ncbi:MAG: T9SS type A sorting domain-containing protein, partial [Bacteroidetes bacterium]|nr:T9SS type A sorting domain-containing protein [Bacteroidota bacterium]